MIVVLIVQIRTQWAWTYGGIWYQVMAHHVLSCSI